MGIRIIKIIFLLITNCSLLIASDKLDVVVLDAGHGGKDPGTTGLSGVREKDIVLPLTLKLGELIRQKFPDVKVVFTRTTDEFIELRERSAIANNSKGKLFISIHANYKKLHETEKNGFEIYLMNRERFPEAVAVTGKDNRLIKFVQSGNDSLDRYIFSSVAQSGYLKFAEMFASNIEMSMLSFTEIASRGVMQAGFWVVVGSSMPSVLVECGYLSDPAEEKLLMSENGQNNVASALSEAFAYYKMMYELQ